MEEHSNTNRVYWLQLILDHHAFLTQAATLSCSSSSRRPPRASPSATSPAAPRMHPGRTYACRSALVPAAAPPRLLRKPRVYLCLKLSPAHVEPASHMAEVPIPVALASRSERPDRLPAREASSAHGHVSGGKQEGLEDGWLYEEGPMWRLRATSRWRRARLGASPSSDRQSVARSASRRRCACPGQSHRWSGAPRLRAAARCR